MTSLETRISLSTPVKQAMTNLLNDAAGMLLALHLQTKLAHWNVRGPHFMAYHELFDQIAEQTLASADALAERAATLGGSAGQTLSAIAQRAPLSEWPLAERQDAIVIGLLIERVGEAANMIRQAIDVAAKAGDAGTADLFTEVSRQLDKNLWFLEAHRL